MVPWDTDAIETNERAMTLLDVLNLIFAVAVVACVAAICRAAYLRAEHKHGEPTQLETAEPIELDRAA